jgi:phage portal protein BeeE
VRPSGDFSAIEPVTTEQWRDLMRNVLDEKLKPRFAELNDKLTAAASGMRDLHDRMGVLETRMATIEKSKHSPSVVSWFAMAISLVDLGLVIATLIR